ADAKGASAAKHAGVEGITMAGDGELGEVLAGAPAEVDTAILRVVSLPYEQFTKCVVVPQGEFAASLHAKPGERQKILVNLLGLDVYGRIRERANGLATGADAQLAAIDQHLAAMTDADDAALEAATERVATIRTLGGAVDQVQPKLAAARQAAQDATEALATLDTQIDRLATVRTPADAATLAATSAGARAKVNEAAKTVTAAEEAEEKLRGELAAAGDATALRRLLDAHAERERLAGDAETIAATLAQAEKEHSTAVSALTTARTGAEQAQRALDDAREAYQAAVATDRAAALRPHLRVGDACPVCTQTVTALPAVAHDSTVAAAEKAGKAAKKRADAADAAVEERDKAARELDRNLAGARAHGEQIQARLTALEERLDGAPGSGALRRDLAAITKLNGALEKAAAAVRTAREAHRTASTGADRAEQ